MTLVHTDIIQLTMVSTESYSNLEDSLYSSRDLSELDNTLWNDNCDYVDIENYTDLNPNNLNLIVLHLNIRSLLSHQQELNQLIRKTEKKNSKIDIILLCETFLSKNTHNMVNVNGFTHMCNYRKEKKGGGVSILVRDGIAYSVVRRRGRLAPRQPLSVCALLPAYEENRHLRPLGNLGHRLRRPRWID